MKNCIVYSIIIAGTLFSSCKKDWVDTLPNGSPSTANQWEGAVNAVKNINALYEPMTDESTFGRELFWMQDASDDLIVGRSKADGENIKNFIPTGREGYMTGPWNQLYWMLNKANVAIGGLPTATGVTEELRTRLLGEAYFMRGFAHFWLAYLWGHEKQGVPYDAVENEGFGTRIPPQLPSVTDNFTAIVADMQKASEMLPLFETYGSDDRGRAHKAAALAYMVKTYAYWAQYDASKWEPVPALCDRIKNECNRALIRNKATFRKNYEAVFSIENNWSSEYIWSVTSGNRGGSIFPGVVLENKGWGAYNGWGYFQP
ncbi:MAG: RagB/SusD family nutrient uptake outer membrane protein, partial [Agriterribacter sp.]